jgi:hypothetical protein
MALPVFFIYLYIKYLIQKTFTLLMKFTKANIAIKELIKYLCRKFQKVVKRN